jgi:hypothetical protein
MIVSNLPDAPAAASTTSGDSGEIVQFSTLPADGQEKRQGRQFKHGYPRAAMN